MQQTENTIIFGFDSAWTDKANAPGAVCAVSFGEGGCCEFHPPELVSFSRALDFIESKRSSHAYSLVALDQPTKVPNASGSRPVEKVAAALVSFVGGGVQPANRGKIGMFCDNAPIWSFLDRLGATENPLEAPASNHGHFLMEVFPALALPSLDDRFAERLGAPKYNPQNGRMYRRQDWNAVARLVEERAKDFGVPGLAAWAKKMHDMPLPRKSDQDKLDAALCAIIGIAWRFGQPSSSVMLGDLDSGYMVSPISNATRGRLQNAAARRGVSLVIPER